MTDKDENTVSEIIFRSRRYVRRAWPRAKDFLFDLFLRAAYVLVSIGGAIYFVRYMISLTPDGSKTVPNIVSPVDLAAVAAALGGLILVGAFYRERGMNEKASAQEEALARELKSIAKLFLISAILFIITFLLLQVVVSLTTKTLTWREYSFVIPTAIVGVFAPLTLCVAIIRLIRIIGRL